MKHIDHHIARIEQFFNPVDCIPFVGSYTGMVRILAGAVEVAAGIAFGLIQALFASDKRYLSAFQQGYLYSRHGFANIIRGSIAMLPGINLVLFAHDNYVGRVNYPGETMQKGVYPLCTRTR